MTEPTETNRRPRREGKRTACAREGCRRLIHAGSRYPTCSFLCSSVRSELEEAERVTLVSGDGKLWAAAVALNDALDQYRDLDNRVFLAALDSGFSGEQWREIKRGTTT